jgi:hypothetical protein
MDSRAAVYFLIDAGFWVILIMVTAVFVTTLIDETIAVIRQHRKGTKVAAISRSAQRSHVPGRVHQDRRR